MLRLFILGGMRGSYFALVSAFIFVTSCAASGERGISTISMNGIGESIQTQTSGLRSEVLGFALRAYECGRARGEIDKPLLTVIDYSLPSTRKRLWVIDLERRRVLFNELVAHGKQSGEITAESFSNRIGSNKSSLGLFRTSDTYQGRHGYSLNLDGLEPGVNDRAYDRRIVVHGANYVAPEFVSKHGRLGRSLGCPALDPRVSRRLIDEIKGGGALFAFYPDREWLAASSYLRCDAAGATRRDPRYAAASSRRPRRTR
jgi:hypothetical protein